MRARDPEKEKTIRRKALELAVKEGFDGLSMHKIARAAMVSAGTLYVYFEDRDDLLIQIYLEESGRAFDAMMENFDPGMSFAEGLRTQWLNRARYYMKNPAGMLFLEQFKYSPLHERALALGNPRFREAMQAFVRGAIQRGELVRAPIEVYWSTAFAPLYNLLKFHTQGKSLPGAGRFVLSESLLLQTLELVLKALTPSPAEKAAALAATAHADATLKKQARNMSARTPRTRKTKE
jgi:AcrR family transcriptional regulator